jgi:O-antigen/teichoic acid export membrane protein
MYLVILPKYFSASIVGAYFFAEKIRDTLLTLFVNSIQSVAYPALSSVQKDHSTLYRSHQKIMILTTFVVFPLMLVCAILTPVIFHLLLPEHWSIAAQYLQWMFLASVFFPLHALNLNILKVKGRAKLAFYLTLYKRAVNVVVFIVSLDYGVIGVIYGQCLLTIMHLAPHLYFSEKTIGYPMGVQISDVLPSLFCALFSVFFIFCIEGLFALSESLEVILLMIIFAGVYVLTSRLFNPRAFNLFTGVIGVLLDQKVGR